MTPGSILGSSVRRREDPRLVTGAGRYTEDAAPGGSLFAAFVRSHLAHARILGVDTSAAQAAPDVVAVLTGADLDLEPRLAFAVLDEAFARPPLARDVVRFAGDPVAVVVAETRAAAADAVQLVEVEYDALPAVAGVEAASADGAAVLFPDHGTNLAFELETGNAAGEDALAGAEVVVRQRMLNQRVAAVPLEGNAISVEPVGAGLLVRISTQSPFQVRDAIAEALGLPEDAVRCVVEDVGGGFGAKIAVYPEHVVVAATAHRLGRSVRWAETRSENLVAMNQGRGQVQDVELGATRDGRLVGLRVRVVADAGAYPEQGAFLPYLTGQMATGVYAIPRVDFAARSYATNTTPTAAYRGAGRPEATALVERAMDLLAGELGLDPVELRRRNLLPKNAFPHTTPTGATYDTGDYDRALDEALRLAGYEDWRAEQRRRRAAGDKRLLGIGVSCYVEVTAVGSPTEHASAELTAEGRIQVTAGTMSNGQGHATTFAMLAADRLGVPMEMVDVIEGDTAVVARGDGTSGSRSVQLGGSAVAEAAAELLERIREAAARLLEAEPTDLELAAEGVRVRGVPARTVAWTTLAARSPDLKAESDFFTGDQTYPFGTHVTVVEVDAETGAIAVLRHVAVDDCGTVINPRLAEGQVQGGVAQGLAQALFEEVIYDAGGTPRTTTLLDYSVPTCNEMPPLLTAHTETPTPHNPLGAKGIGESGTIGSTPAVWNAVIDALAPLGVRHLDMPLTPDRIWRAISKTH